MATQKSERDKYLDAYYGFNSSLRTLYDTVDSWSEKYDINQNNTPEIKNARRAINRIQKQIPEFSEVDNKSIIATIDQLATDISNIEKALTQAVGPKIAAVQQKQAMEEAERIVSKAPDIIKDDLIQFEKAKKEFNKNSAEFDSEINSLKNNTQNIQNTTRSSSDLIKNYIETNESVETATRNKNLSILGIVGGSLLTLVGAGILLATGPIGFFVGAGLIAAGLSTVGASAYSYREADIQLETSTAKLNQIEKTLPESIVNLKDQIGIDTAKLNNYKPQLQNVEKTFNTSAEQLKKAQNDISLSQTKLNEAEKTLGQSDLITSLNDSLTKAQTEIDNLLAPTSQNLESTKKLIEATKQQFQQAESLILRAEEIQQARREISQVDQGRVEVEDFPPKARDNTSLAGVEKAQASTATPAPEGGITSRFGVHGPTSPGRVAFGDRSALNEQSREPPKPK